MVSQHREETGELNYQVDSRNTDNKKGRYMRPFFALGPVSSIKMGKMAIKNPKNP